MKQKEIELLSSKIKKTTAWKNAEDDYFYVYADSSLPPQFKISEPLTNEEITNELQKIIDECPSFYPAYFDLGTRVLSVDMDKATIILDTAFEICIKISSWNEVSKDFDIIFDNFEKSLHEEFTVRYVLKLIDRFPDKAILYDYVAYAFNVLGEYAKSIEYQIKAVALEPKNTYFLNNLGVFYLSDKCYSEAEKYFNLSIKADPKHENPVNNLADCKTMEKKNLSLKEYYLLPVNYEKIREYEEKEDYSELDSYVSEINNLKLLVFRSSLSESNQYKVHKFHSLLSTLQVFFGFVKTISNDAFIWEDIDYFCRYFKPIMHKFIFKHGDTDDEILTEIYESTFLYYNFLCKNNLISNKDFTEFKNHSNSLKNELFDKMHRYNIIRHDPNISANKKEKIREELFEGDRDWMFIN